MRRASVHSHRRDLHPSQLIPPLNLKFERAILLLADGYADVSVILTAAVALAPDVVDLLDSTALEGVSGGGGVEHRASVEFSASADFVHGK